MDHATLKQRHRRERKALPVNLNLRVHRALSWLGRADSEQDDPDARHPQAGKLDEDPCYPVVEPAVQERT
jgi:hypothetical protein